MSDHIDKLRADFHAAEAKAQQIMADRDEAFAKARDRFDERLRKANDAAATAQKKLNDAEAAQALADRDDIDDDTKRGLADSLGLTLPE